ncbi:MAG: choice-of-anchor V domain-containing protein [Pseudomonadota bacterium]
MTPRVLLTGAALGVGLASLAWAYPEGSPWGAADPTADEHCASCHWERQPVMASRALDLDGLPKRIAAGQAYVLTVTLTGTDAAVSGFQLIASAEGQPAGLFESGDRDVESAAIGAQIRSTATRPTTGDMARWRLVWRAPAKLDGPVIFHAAASAANDDGSPFGDQIHYREFSREPLQRPKKKGPLAPKD